MKATCSIEKLKKAILSAERITGKNLTLPVLSTILLIVKDKNITIRATNLNVGIQIDVPAKIEEEGIICVSGQVVNGVLANISDNDTITLETKNESLVVKTTQNKITLKLFPHEDFPTLPLVEGVRIKLPTQKLVDGLKSVYYSATLSEIKPEIASVYVYGDEEMLVFVATDSFRLAEKRIKVKNIPDFPGALLPYKNVVEILRVFGDEHEEMEIILSKNQCSFVVGQVYLTSRLVDGVFPDYQQIIPKVTATQAIILKSDLAHTLKLSTIISDKFNQITISLSTKDKKCRIDSKNSDIGEQETFISAALTGPDVDLTLNFKYLVDAFQSLTGDSVAIKVLEPQKPVIIESVGDTSFRYLIMPMNR